MPTLQELSRKVRELEITLAKLRRATTPAIMFPVEWKLSRGEALLLTWLFTSPNGYRTYKALGLLAQNYAFKKIVKGEVMVRTNVHTLRNKLRPHGIFITTIFGEGLQLGMTDRMKVKAGIEKELWWLWPMKPVAEPDHRVKSVRGDALES